MEFKNPFGAAANLTLRAIWIGFMVLVLMIPVFQITSLVKERQDRQRAAETEISSIWSTAQAITGPFLVIPYWELGADLKTIVRKNAFVLPDSLDIKSEVSPELRHRSIYKVAVYNSQLTLAGTISKPDFKKLNLDSSRIYWNEITMQLGLSDFRGITDQLYIEWNDAKKPMEGGVAANGIIEKGVKTNFIPGEIQNQNKFVISFNLKGSEQISFAPVGKITSAEITSNWPNPSFKGAFLPSEPAVITDKGFSAKWKILELNRDYPQQFKDSQYPIAESAFAVNFLQPVDLYSKTERSVKYAFLFIALTFGLYFFMELFLKNKMHSLQYLMVGFALSLFYLLLLSISEYTGFDWAYVIAATAIILLIGGYTYSLFKQKRTAFLFSGTLTLLYGFIYLLIQLQERALLIGSISLFLLLALLMYVTRNLDWAKEN